MKTYKFRKSMDIGKLDAETDVFLDSCFYISDIYKGLIDFDKSDKNPSFIKRIIVGRTGSGKTALLKQLSKDGVIKRYDKIEAENTIFEHIKNNIFINSLINSGIDLRVFYKSLWIHVLLVKVINLLHRSSYDSFFERIKLRLTRDNKLSNSYIDKFKDNFFNENIVKDISNRMQDDLSANFEVAGLSISGGSSSESIERIQSTTSSYVSKELLSQQKEIIRSLNEDFTGKSQIRIVISIDDLDKSWLSESSIRYSFINALMDAFRELLNICSVKILISIRTDILMGIYSSSLRQQEKDLSLIYNISWNEREIREILDKRINYLIKNQYSGAENVKFQDVFNFQVLGEDAADYIIKRTMLRPRDAINFVNLCLSECDGDVELNENIVLKAEEKFYASRKQALIQEWKSIYPYINDYIDSLACLNQQVFSRENMKNCQEYLLKQIDSSSEDKKHENIILNDGELLNVWFVIGCVGLKKSESLTIFSSFEKSELDITDYNKKFEIHPLFFRL